MLTESSPDEHFNDDQHKEKYIQCQDEKKKYDLANPVEEKVNTPTETELEVVEEKETFGTNNAAVNNIETVTGKTLTNDETKKAGNTESEQQTSQQTIKATHPKKIKKPVRIQKEESNDPATFALDNNLVYTSRSSIAFCKTCDKRFPSTLHNMKQHVLGRDHINKIAKAASKPAPKKNKLKKQSMEHFVKNVLTFPNTPDNDIVINETICVLEKSCNFFTKVRCKFSEFKCQICVMNLCEDDLEEHCRTVAHEKGMRQTQIVLGLKNELVREVR